MNLKVYELEHCFNSYRYSATSVIHGRSVSFVFGLRKPESVLDLDTGLWESQFTRPNKNLERPIERDLLQGQQRTGVF